MQSDRSKTQGYTRRPRRSSDHHCLKSDEEEEEEAVRTLLNPPNAADSASERSSGRAGVHHDQTPGRFAVGPSG